MSVQSSWVPQAVPYWPCQQPVMPLVAYPTPISATVSSAAYGGLPAVSVPVETAGGLPAGACLVGPPGTDRALLDLAVALTA